jgi:hypothetical protein
MTVEHPSSISRMASAGRPRIFLNLGLVLLSLVYIGYVVSRHIADLHGAKLTVNASGVAGFIVFATASISLSTLYHVLLVSSLVPASTEKSRLGLAYAVGQIVRYLPGKVMGLLFQANYLRSSVPAGTIALALLIQMALAYFWAGAMATAILASSWFGSSWPLLVLIPAAALLWQAQRAGWAQRVLQMLPYVGRYLGGDTGARLGKSTATALTLLLLANWLPFFAGWAWLLRGALPFGEAMLFAAAYLAASIASTAVILLPSGIVVREAIFLWVGGRYGLPVTQLLFYAVLARLVLTAADVLNAMLFWALHAWQQHPRLRE